MSRVSEVIARGAGLDEKTCELILYSSIMHDVGKVGIPDRVLLKPGKLDGEEWEIMKMHGPWTKHLL
jgi:putative two-component system response regulator